MKRLIVLALLLSPLAIYRIREARTTGAPVGVDRVVTQAWAANSPEAALADDVLLVRGYPMATPERAANEAREQAAKKLDQWLVKAGLPGGWNVPDELFKAVARPVSTEQIDRDYGTVYVQTLSLDLSDQSRQAFLRAYDREVSHQRLLQSGGILGFVLVVLLVFRSYLRLDESTKGYYTTALRVGSTLAIAATGTVLIFLLV